VVVALSPTDADAIRLGVDVDAPNANEDDDAYGYATDPEPPEAVTRRPNCSVPGVEFAGVPPIAAIEEEADERVPPFKVRV
jgi:hypothetical protein